MLQVRPTVIISENVEKWPWEYVALWLDDYYVTVESCVLNNTSFGFPVERTRRYTVFVRKGFMLTQSLSGATGIASTLGRAIGPQHTYLDYLIADHRELDCELMWACTRDESSAPCVLTTSDRRAFERSPVPFEHRHLNGFRKRVRGVAYTLSQDPEERLCFGKPRVLHCLTAGAHLIWIDGNDVDRWISGRELLAFQGLPTYARWTRAINPTRPAQCCSFNSSRLKMGLPPRNRRHMTTQAGNGMHTAVVGSVILWVLRFVHADSSSVPRPLSALSDRAACDSSTPLPCPFSTPLALVGVDVAAGDFDNLFAAMKPSKRRMLAVCDDVSSAASDFRTTLVSQPVPHPSSSSLAADSVATTEFDALFSRMSVRTRRRVTTTVE